VPTERALVHSQQGNSKLAKQLEGIVRYVGSKGKGRRGALRLFTARYRYGQLVVGVGSENPVKL